MSHYRVAVIHKHDSYDEIADLLAPYSELLEVEPYIWLSREDAIAYARKHYDMGRKHDKTCWEFMAKDHQTDEDGNIYTDYNPNSKWDYWGDIDTCKVKHLKKKKKGQSVREWMPTYAVVTADGTWHSPGDVGWFGSSTESDEQWEEWEKNYNRFFEKVDPDYYVTIVDCHI